jgi:Bacteriophage HK97-gp10, putative tail-component
MTALQKFIARLKAVTNLNDLNNEIMQRLRNYAADVQDEIEVASKEEAQNLVRALKKDSPKLTGSYKKGWRLKKSGRNKYVVYNKTDYQLTHLLEHGHAKRDGGRVPAKVHIRPAEEKAVRNFLDRVEGAIRP